MFKKYQLNSIRFGFLAVQNTFDTPTERFDKAYMAINLNRVLITVSLEFAEAFDIVYHEFIFQKLYYYDFRGKSFDWFPSFLSNNSLFLIYQQSCSSLELKIGVSYCSMMDPLLLVIVYINNLNKSHTMVKSIPFKDDRTLYLNRNSSTDHTSLINSELFKV